jgi:hypothetical protein
MMLYHKRREDRAGGSDLSGNRALRKSSSIVISAGSDDRESASPWPPPRIKGNPAFLAGRRGVSDHRLMTTDSPSRDGRCVEFTTVRKHGRVGRRWLP